MGKYHEGPMNPFYAYPLHHSGPFVYYQSLLSKTGAGAAAVAGGAQSYLLGKSNIINNQNERSRDRISKALMILKRGSVSEAKKETDFLETLNEDLKGSGLEPLPDITEDPFGFINSLNALLLGEEEYKNALTTERKRIKEYKEAVRLYGDSNKKIHQAIKKGLIDSSILHNTANTIEGLNSGGKKGNSSFTTYSALGSKRSLASEISEAVMDKIFSKYLDKIIDFSSGEVVINGGQLAAISALVTSEIEKRFLNSHDGKEITKKNIKTITEAIRESSAYDDIIEALTSSSAEALTTLDSFAKNAYNQKEANSLMGKRNFKRTAVYRNSVSKIQEGLKKATSFEPLSEQTLKKLYSIAGEAGVLSATINVSAYFHSEASLASLA